MQQLLFLRVSLCFCVRNLIRLQFEQTNCNILAFFFIEICAPYLAWALIKCAKLNVTPKINLLKSVKSEQLSTFLHVIELKVTCKKEKQLYISVV